MKKLSKVHSKCPTWNSLMRIAMSQDKNQYNPPATGVSVKDIFITYKGCHNETDNSCLIISL